MPEMPTLAVRRAPLPYYKPWVIINTATNEAVGWAKTEGEARKTMELMQKGYVEAGASPIQPTGDVLAAHESRMTHPFGDKPQTLISRPGNLGRRRVEL